VAGTNWKSLFWQNCTGGLLHHPDFFDNIAEKARIYVGDIDRLEKDKLILQTGEEIPSDVILCGTGWHLSLQFFSNELRQELGLPHPINETTKEEAHWTELEAAADIKVTSRFPMLANPPPHYHKPVTETPYRLYRGIVPISESSSPIDHSIVFIGQIGVGNYFMTGECQAMWATAYLDGKLNLPTREEQENTVAMFTSWCKRRYLSHGDEAITITLESGHYNDLLLEDLGLKSHRKGWFKDFWAVQWASDYKGLRWEFMKRFGYEDEKEN
jgi:dimethylaniline monooxygenase (N-oxide forming)